MEPWSRVYMDHAYTTGVGLLLIQVDTFSGWPEIIRLPQKKGYTIKQILKVIFSRNDMLKTLVSDNAPEFCDEDITLWLEQIGCKLPYHPQSNGLTERMVQTVKTGLKSFSQQKEKLEVFLPRLVLSYRTIPHAGRLETSSVLMRSQVRVTLTISYSTNEIVWYKKNKESIPERAEFIIQKATIQL